MGNKWGSCTIIFCRWPLDRCRGDSCVRCVSSSMVGFFSARQALGSQAGEIAASLPQLSFMGLASPGKPDQENCAPFSTAVFHSAWQSLVSHAQEAVYTTSVTVPSGVDSNGESSWGTCTPPSITGLGSAGRPRGARLRMLKCHPSLWLSPQIWTFPKAMLEKLYPPIL